MKVKHYFRIIILLLVIEIISHIANLIFEMEAYYNLTGLLY